MVDSPHRGALVRRGESVSESVLLHLQRLIVTGAIPPGTRLAPERSLAADLEVSRSALREALSRLEATGLIERRHGSGTRVSSTFPLTSALARHATHEPASLTASAELRTVVEPQIARLAASRIRSDELDRLERILASTEATWDPDSSVSHDVAFHAGVAAATRNPLLASLSELTASWTVEARIYSHVHDEGRRVSRAGHARILRALAGHDPDAAEAAMRVHLDEIAELVETVVQGDASSGSGDASSG